ncbi:hypothetical protein Q7P35_007402 [Cladosporium inversicolor]
MDYDAQSFQGTVSPGRPFTPNHHSESHEVDKASSRLSTTPTTHAEHETILPQAEDLLQHQTSTTQRHSSEGDFAVIHDDAIRCQPLQSTPLIADHIHNNHHHHHTQSCTSCTQAAFNEAQASSSALQRPTSSQDQSDHDELTPPKKVELAHTNIACANWKPFWLRRYTLLALAALFASLAAGLIILWHANQAQNGFRTALTTNHYAWTYGPTAILTIILSLWRQVDYHCKLMQPWNELSKGSSDADRSLLLDYLSPIHTTSLFRAIRYRHIPVLASILCFVVLKIVILLSTGLLVLAPVSIDEARNVTLVTAFDTQSFRSQVPDIADVPFITSAPVNAFSDMFTLPVHAYIKSLQGGGNGTVGMMDNIVFQSIDGQAFDPTLVSISVDVDAFVPNISCEIATATPRLAYNNDFHYQLDTPTCSVGAVNQTEIWAFDCGGEQCKDGREYEFTRVDCLETDVAQSENALDDNAPKDIRWAMVVSNLSPLNLRYSTNASARWDLTLNRDDKPLNISTSSLVSAVICKTGYSMQRATLLQNATNSTVVLEQPSMIPALSNFTGEDLGEMIYLAISGSESFRVPEDILMSPLWKVLSETLDEPKTRDRLLSAETLQRAANHAWAGIAANLVREIFLRPATIEASGTVTVAENRLCIGAASLWGMVTGLLLAVMLTISIMFSTLGNCVPRDPGLISTDALVLASSPQLQALLRDCSSMRTSAMAAILRKARYSTDTSHPFSITALRSEQSEDQETPKAKSKDWIPLVAQIPMVVATLAVPIIVIFILEALYQISIARDGLVDVFGVEVEASYLSRYSVAFVSLVTATLFNSLDFTTASFAPYCSLQSGTLPGSRGLDLHILGALPPVALLRSIQSRHAGSFCSNIAGMIGSLLTVVASGLLVVNRAVKIEQTVAASLSSQWDITWYNSSQSGDGGAGVMFDQFQRGSVGLPSRIWNGIVMSDIANIRSLPTANLSLALKQTPVTSNYTFQVDGLRPHLSCEIVHDEYISFEYHDTHKDSIAVSVSVAVPLPPSCLQGNDSVGYYRYSSGGTFTPTNTSTYWGDFVDLHHGPWASDKNYSSKYNYYDLAPFGEDMFNPGPDNAVGCPSIGVIFRDVSHADVPHDNVTAIVCSQKLQQVRVNVTYSGLDLTVPSMSASIAPIVIADSATDLTNGTDGFDTFPYRVQTYLQSSRLSHGNLTMFSGDNATDRLDGFTNHLVWGPNGTAAADLFGVPNRQRFIDAVSGLYARYMCFAIDMRLRHPIAARALANTTDDEGYLEGTAYGFSSRIEFNQASKITMQVMLGVMALLGACTHLASDLRGTLPRKPTFIASRMALLAGSDLCEGQKALLPPNAIHTSEKELDKLFDGYMFGLGWWRQTAASCGESDIPDRETCQDDQAGTYNHAEETLCETKRRYRRGRFGIDVGVPEQRGFRETKWSVLRRRLTRHSSV